ncbi:hypothetical protein FRC12_003674 [Ceratobasidium sp. 428]|nr:hypothetical protein FRC12_003674 [Ceratobasidium sp. 428]
MRAFDSRFVKNRVHRNSPKPGKLRFAVTNPGNALAIVRESIIERVWPVGIGVRIGNWDSRPGAGVVSESGSPQDLESFGRTVQEGCAEAPDVAIWVFALSKELVNRVDSIGLHGIVTMYNPISDVGRRASTVGQLVLGGVAVVGESSAPVGRNSAVPPLFKDIVDQDCALSNLVLPGQRLARSVGGMGGGKEGKGGEPC